MTALVDTSALYALMDADDLHHEQARASWPAVLAGESPLTHNYVVVETCALVQRRLGMKALRSLVDEVLAPIPLVFVPVEVHEQALAALLARGHREVSLVDTVSMELMRRHGITSAFAFDAHFRDLGFNTIP